MQGDSYPTLRWHFGEFRLIPKPRQPMNPFRLDELTQQRLAELQSIAGLSQSDARALVMKEAETAALHDATGIWFNEVPLTPARVLAGLKAAGFTGTD